MSDKTTIQSCIDRYASNQAAKELVGGEAQKPADEILEILVKVGGKITEVSFLKSIIKHIVFGVLTSHFFERKI